MSFLFGDSGGFVSHENPYINQLANLGFEYGPARKYYKGILKGAQQGDYSKLPGMGMFDNEIAKLNDSYDHQSSGLTQGPLADRIKQLTLDRQKDAINGQRFGFAQNATDNAARGLADIWSQKNQFNLGKLGQAAGLENGRFQYRPPTQGFLGQALGSAAGSLLGGFNPASFGKMFGGGGWANQPGVFQYGG